MDAAPSSVDRVIVDAILSGRLCAGACLGEQKPAAPFAASLTGAHKALIHLEPRDIVHVSARRGWFVTKPSFQETQEGFQARRAIGKGILITMGSIGSEVVSTLRDLTARTVLLSALDQSSHEASASCDGHEAVVDILADGDRDGAADLMARQVGDVEAGLHDCEETDPCRICDTPSGRGPKPAGEPRHRVGAASGSLRGRGSSGLDSISDSSTPTFGGPP